MVLGVSVSLVRSVSGIAVCGRVSLRLLRLLRLGVGEAGVPGGDVVGWPITRRGGLWDMRLLTTVVRRSDTVLLLLLLLSLSASGSRRVRSIDGRKL